MKKEGAANRGLSSKPGLRETMRVVADGIPRRKKKERETGKSRKVKTRK